MELHSKNLALEDMSGIDELTGVFKRRGFYSAACELVRGTCKMSHLQQLRPERGYRQGGRKAI